MPWKEKWFQLSVLLFLAFIWGSSFILMKIALKSYSSPQVAALRILMASLVLLPFSIRNIKYITKSNIKSLLIAGFIGSFIPAFLFTKAQTRIDSSLAGMLNSLTPVFTLIVGLLLYNSPFRSKQILGLAIGLLGAVGLIISGKEFALGNFNLYALLIVLATTCYAVNVNEIKKNLTYLNGVQITSLSFMFLGPVSLIYLMTTEFNAVVESEDWGVNSLAIVGLGVVGTAGAMLVMNTLIRYASAVFATSVTYIIPVFAIFWGILDGEHIVALHFLFMIMVLFGVYLINRSKQK